MRMARRAPHAACLALGLLLLASGAQAQLELGSALRSLERHGTRQLPRALLRTPNGRVPVLAEYPAESGLAELLVAGRYRPMWLSEEEIGTLAREQPDLKLHWAPPRRTQLDQADDW